ncbi:MAG: hypothetical protein KZQ81_14285 [Candidatus Thiodiazotropha sp. (ex Rostrolucina anterorostrata)]|nr:hypothetical protein [Candidatus Thiodiazotropha sp. (ex Rostrolucina anterorostrata)]
MIIIIKNKQTNIVHYAESQVSLTPDGCIVKGAVDARYTTANCTADGYYGNLPDFYAPDKFSFEDGIFTRVVNDHAEKDEALSNKLIEIFDKFESIVNADFEYLDNIFAADYLQISGMATVAGFETPTNELPTVDGVWTTVEYEADGITPVTVPFTCGGFLVFATAFADRRTVAYANKTVQEVSIKTLHANPDSTPEQIAEYDFAGGW